MPEEETALVTEDRCMKEDGGQLDETDQQILNEASQNGRVRVRVINIKEMFEVMKSTEPRKYEQFKETMERQAGKPLTFNELVELGRQADERMKEFVVVVADMTLGQAAQVRLWRVDGHLTWRAVARVAYLEGWFHRNWSPPSNQIMGMAVCERAAGFFGEDYMAPPWN